MDKKLLLLIMMNTHTPICGGWFHGPTARAALQTGVCLLQLNVWLVWFHKSGTNICLLTSDLQ